MQGDGELWLNRDGLPVREMLYLSFPEHNDEQVAARITIDFSDWGPLPAGPLFAARLAAGMAGLGSDPAPLVGLALGIVLLALLVRFRHARVLQQASVLALICALVFSPLLTGQRSAAFWRAQSAKAAEQQQNREADRLAAEARAPQFAPHADPHAEAVVRQTVRGHQLAAPAPQSANPSGDDDGDTLSNREEESLGTSSATVDQDGDKIPDGRDSDYDSIDDNLELHGFPVGNNKWYADPLSPDSNQDGLSDAEEWDARRNGGDAPDDTDGDGTPDLFDNDNDGVPDAKDAAPFMHSRMRGGSAAYFAEDNAFALTLNGLQAGKPVYVDFQVRPKNEKHLWYAYNVLDWPIDRQGQIQDDDNGTFADLAADPGVQRQPSDGNGDMKLVPMLEIRTPATPNHLPVQEELSSYNIVVNQLPAEAGATTAPGNVAYVPLTLVTDEDTGARVAFNGRMVYRPAAAWGAPRRVRLVWVVQALLDDCEQSKDGVSSCITGTT